MYYKSVVNRSKSCVLGVLLAKEKTPEIAVFEQISRVLYGSATGIRTPVTWLRTTRVVSAYRNSGGPPASEAKNCTTNVLQNCRASHGSACENVSDQSVQAVSAANVAGAAFLFETIVAGAAFDQRGSGVGVTRENFCARIPRVRWIVNARYVCIEEPCWQALPVGDFYYTMGSFKHGRERF